MSVAIDKAKISGIVAVFASIIALVGNYANLALLVCLGTFLFTLMIQYGSIKFKIVGSSLLIGFITWLVSHGGFK
jgi:hypothetical protein